MRNTFLPASVYQDGFLALDNGKCESANFILAGSHFPARPFKVTLQWPTAAAGLAGLSPLPPLPEYLFLLAQCSSQMNLCLNPLKLKPPV